MDKKKVAVLMATYNGEKYFKEQADSLLNQKGVDIEILVRDDGSSDNTTALLNEYQNKGVLTWFAGKHINAAYGFFELLSKVPEADYYAFCDQDDVWDEDKLLCAVKKLEKIQQGRLGLYCCGARLTDEKLNFLSNHKLDKNRAQFARLFFSNIAGNTMVINNELRSKIITHYPETAGMHDSWIYKTAVCLGAEIIIDPEPHLDYRQHGTNTVGMELSFSQKIGKFFDIVKNEYIYKQLIEIKEVYGAEILPEYYDLLCKLEKSKYSLTDRISLAFDKRINFNNIFFNLAFKLKILFGCL